LYKRDMIDKRLGKLEPKEDRLGRTITLKSIMRSVTELPPRPKKFNVTSLNLKSPAPQMWGNDQEGCCVEVDICNHQTYFELVEQDKVLPITTKIVSKLYHRIAGPGDNGTYFLDAFNYWYKYGIKVGCKRYKIEAFTSVDWKDMEQLKYAIWLLNGVDFGAQITNAAMEQFDEGKPWDVVSSKVIGGHGIFLGGYDDETGLFDFWTWGKHQYATPEWIEKRGDEAFIAVDKKNNKNSILNIPLLNSYLDKIKSGV